jgi:hypothetical protein
MNSVLLFFKKLYMMIATELDIDNNKSNENLQTKFIYT